MLYVCVRDVMDIVFSVYIVRRGAVDANCVKTFRPQQWGSDLPFLGNPVMRTCWVSGAVPQKGG